MRRIVIGALALIASMAASTSATATAEQTGAGHELALRSQTYAVRHGTDAQFSFGLPSQLSRLVTDIGNRPTPSPSTSAPPTGESPSSSTLQIEVQAFDRVTTRSEVEAALAGGFGGPIDTYSVALGPYVTEGEAGGKRISLTVPIEGNQPSPARLDLIDPGIYPLTMSILRDGVAIGQHTTFVERLRDSQVSLGPLHFGVLATVDGIAPNHSSAQLEAVRSQLVELAKLGELIDAPITARVPPSAITEALDSNPALRQRVSDALADESVLSDTLVDVDVDAVAAADLDQRFAELRQLGTAIVDDTFGRSTIVDEVYLGDHPLTESGVELLDDHDFRFIVLSDGALSELNSGAIDVARVDTSLLISSGTTGGDELLTAVIDPVMELLDSAAFESTSTPAATAVELMAIVSSMRQNADPALRSLVLTTPSLGVPDPEMVAHLAGFVNEHPEFEFTPLAELPASTNLNFNDGDALRFDWPTVLDGRLLARELALESTRDHIAAAASMLPNNDDRRERWDVDIGRALSTSITDSEAVELLADARAAAERVLDSVPAPEPFSFTLTGSESELQLRLVNEDTAPLEVIARLESDRLSADDTALVLPPGEVTNVVIPLDVRSNGRTPVELQLLTPDGTALFEPVQLSARVSTLSGLGRVVSVGALLVLLTWWLTYVQRRHRSRRADSDSVDSAR